MHPSTSRLSARWNLQYIDTLLARATWIGRPPRAPFVHRIVRDLLPPEDVEAMESFLDDDQPGLALAR